MPVSRRTPSPTVFEEAGIGIGELEQIVFYDKPLVKFERLLETYLAYAPQGLPLLRRGHAGLAEGQTLSQDHPEEGTRPSSQGCTVSELPPLLFTEHHQSHAASAFFPSPFEKAAVLCLDGVGEWATTSVWLGEGNELTPQWEIDFPHSLGLLYSAFTYYTGFKVNSGEYKLMGLAPYGEPKYVDVILEQPARPQGGRHLPAEHGLFQLRDRSDHDQRQVRMQLFGGPPRKPEAPLDAAGDGSRPLHPGGDRGGDAAAGAHRPAGDRQTDYLCLAGGVALNCVANGRILREGPFKDIWIQPAAGDAGGALGAALVVWHQYLDKPRAGRRRARRHARRLPRPALLATTRSGACLDRIGASYQRLRRRTSCSESWREILAERERRGLVPGAHGVRAARAGRALHHRRSAQREDAVGDEPEDQVPRIVPALRSGGAGRERSPSTSSSTGRSPYMLLVAPVREAAAHPHDARKQQQLFGIDKLNVPRSSHPGHHPRGLLGAHPDRARARPTRASTRCSRRSRTTPAAPVLVNTSFNVRGEPIVCTPEDAYRCFMRTEMDYLVLENFLLAKTRAAGLGERRLLEERIRAGLER